MDQNSQVPDWSAISTAPLNATEFMALMPDGTVHERCHWAEDLTGEDQPPFRGFFIPGPDGGFVGIGKPEKWKPQRRVTRDVAVAAIRSFLAEELGADVPFSLCEDGDDDSAVGKCGWAFWVLEDDTTSYLHEDLTIEWYGSEWELEKLSNGVIEGTNRTTSGAIGQP